MWDIKSATAEELKSLLEEMGEKPFRAKQIFRWIHQRGAASYDEMTDLSAALRKRLAEEHPLTTLKVLERQISEDGTQKFLFELPDGETVESVFMRYTYGNSVCVSSQVGCRMGCRFCASTLDGLKRGLMPSEILEQIYRISVLTGERVSHVVVMGTGEPLDNYDALLRFIRLITDEDGLNLSGRNITVSTCGIVPRIYDLAKEDLPITLAISLHAPNDEKRRTIMPIAEKYSIEEIKQACRAYFKATGRRITFEYSLISGVNDTAQDAEELSRIAGPLSAHINLIPVNPVRERGYKQGTRASIAAFKMRLEKNGINVSIRRVLGRDIDGACGQLRHRKIAESQ